jgi:hypothetical protein
MRWLMVPVLCVLVIPFAGPAEGACPAYFSHDVRKLRSNDRINLCDEFAGRPLLIVNMTSRCGFTPQSEGIEALQRQYKDRGLTVAGVPSNDFKQAAPVPKRLRYFLQREPEAVNAVLHSFLRSVEATLRQHSPGAGPGRRTERLHGVPRFVTVPLIPHAEPRAEPRRRTTLRLCRR